MEETEYQIVTLSAVWDGLSMWESCCLDGCLLDVLSGGTLCFLTGLGGGCWALLLLGVLLWYRLRATFFRVLAKTGTAVLYRWTWS